MTAEQIIVKSDSPDGQAEMVITDADGKVIQRFKHPMHWVAYAPQNAIAVATAMIDAAYAAMGEKMKPAGGAVKHELMERHRKTLTTRVELMLRDIRDDKTQSHYKVAMAVVECCLRECF